MKKLILSLFSLITILLAMNGPVVTAATVCCQYYRTDTGFSCSGWMKMPAAECNKSNGMDYCGNVKGNGRTSTTACGY